MAFLSSSIYATTPGIDIVAFLIIFLCAHHDDDDDDDDDDDQLLPDHDMETRVV